MELMKDLTDMELYIYMWLLTSCNFDENTYEPIESGMYHIDTILAWKDNKGNISNRVMTINEFLMTCKSLCKKKYIKKFNYNVEIRGNGHVIDKVSYILPKAYVCNATFDPNSEVFNTKVGHCIYFLNRIRHGELDISEVRRKVNYFFSPL